MSENTMHVSEEEGQGHGGHVVDIVPAGRVSVDNHSTTKSTTGPVDDTHSSDVGIKKHATGAQEPSFLGLPAEMRTRVYRSALVEPHKIAMQTRDYRTPSLLRTCRQIKEEASPIYYNENKFVYRVHHYDGLAAVPAYQLVKAHRTSSAQNFAVVICEGASIPEESNLLAWLEEYHADPEGTPSLCQNKNAEVYGYQTLARRTFGVVKAMKNKPWEDVEPVLAVFFGAIFAMLMAAHGESSDDEH